jgi:hypothetical protein
MLRAIMLSEYSEVPDGSLGYRDTLNHRRSSLSDNLNLE